MSETKPLGSDWRTIETAPTTGPVVEVEGWNGEIVRRIHWAHGGGEDQPPFGPAWFYPIGEGSSLYYAEMFPPPTLWRPVPAPASPPEDRR